MNYFTLEKLFVVEKRSYDFTSKVCTIDGLKKKCNSFAVANGLSSGLYNLYIFSIDGCEAGNKMLCHEMFFDGEKFHFKFVGEYGE